MSQTDRTPFEAHRWLAAGIVGLACLWLAVGAVVLADEAGRPVRPLTTMGAPTAVDDVYATDEDTPKLLDVTDNDEPSQSTGELRLVSCTTPSPYGAAQLSGGKILFTPANAAEPYTATFHYTIEGQYPDEDQGKVTVVVDADNDPVNLEDYVERLNEDDCRFDGNASIMLDPVEEGEDLTFAFWDPDGEPIQWGEDGTYHYCAQDDIAPYTDTFTVLVTDTAGFTDTALLHFVVTATNQPVVDYHWYPDFSEGRKHYHYYYISHEEYGEPLTLSTVVSPTMGELTLYPGAQAQWAYDAPNRSVSYTDTLAIRLTDTIPSSACFTATITVTAQNDPPWCGYWGTPPDAMVNETYETFVHLEDPDVDQTARLVIASGPSWLSVAPNDDYSVKLTGTPGMQDEGETTVYLRAYDGLVYGNGITLTFDVRPLRQVTYVDGTYGSDTAGHGGGPEGDAYMTINHALGRTAYTGTIRVAPGVYQEGITISQEINLEAYYQGGTGERVVLDGSTSAFDIGLLIYGSDFSVTGFDIVGANKGVHINPGAANVVLRWCNIENNSEWGMSAPHATAAVDAHYNYWGSADGPSGEGDGHGDAVSANVLYDPWLSTRVGGVARETLSGTATLDAQAVTGISATVTSTQPVSLTVAQYESNPQAAFLYEDDLFWDVQLLDDTAVDSMIVFFAIDEAHQEGKQPYNTRIMWWDATAGAWVPCSHQSWVRERTYGRWRSLGIEVVLGPDTVPSLSQLQGTEFGVQAVPEIWPLGLSMKRTGGPARFGPGWNLQFEMVVSNTAPITLHSVVITDIVPNWHNWYAIEGDLGQPEIDPKDRYALHEYCVGELAPGEVLTQTWIYHTPSTMADGMGFLYEAIGTSFEGDWSFVGMGLHCDHSLSEPTPTPTDLPAVALPLVRKG